MIAPARTPTRPPAARVAALAALLHLLLGCSALAVAPAARAQGGLAAHGMGAGSRPLHARLARADHVAVAVVARIEAGRIHFEAARTLAGDAPPAFAVKRSPSRAPRLVEGDAALLLLRGARDPFVLVDDPSELAVFDAGERQDWERALAPLLAGEAGWLALYESWLEHPAEARRRTALVGLLDPRAPFQPLGAGFARRRIEVATDPARPPSLRTASAFAATLAPGGSGRLLEALRGAPELDAQLLTVAVQGAQRTRGGDVPELLVAALDRPDPALRRQAAMLASSVGPHPALDARLAEVAAADEDEATRRAARRALAR